MSRVALGILCALLAGCSSPNFVKLDNSGKIDASANRESQERDLADCKVVEANVRSQSGAGFNMANERAALDNCMRSKGYVKS